jgi:hypothetical protein
MFFFLKWYRRSCFRGERMGDHELLDIEEWGLVLNKVSFFQWCDQRGSKSLQKRSPLCLSNKGPVSRDFDLRFFSWIILPRAFDNSVSSILIFSKIF